MPKPLVSIVVECGTRTITDRIPFQKMAERYLAEARKTFRNLQLRVFSRAARDRYAVFGE